MKAACWAAADSPLPRGLAFGDSGDSGGANVYFETNDDPPEEHDFSDPSQCEAAAAPFETVCRVDGDDDDDIDLGLAVGGGVDVLASNNFSIGFEYLYVDLGDDDDDGRHFDFGDGTTLTLDSGRDNDFHTVKVKGSLLFNMMPRG